MLAPISPSNLTRIALLEPAVSFRALRYQRTLWTTSSVCRNTREVPVKRKMPPALPEGVHREDLHVKALQDGFPLATTVFTPSGWDAQRQLQPAVVIAQATGVPARFYQAFAM